MEKKYKLIKKYPNNSNFQLGDIISTCGNCYSRGNYKELVSSSDVEDYPEFWEEVKEIVNMSFKEGDKFYNHNDPSLIYTIKEISNSKIINLEQLKAIKIVNNLIRDQELTRLSIFGNNELLYGDQSLSEKNLDYMINKLEK